MRHTHAHLCEKMSVWDMFQLFNFNVKIKVHTEYTQLIPYLQLIVFPFFNIYNIRLFDQSCSISLFKIDILIPLHY